MMQRAAHKVAVFLQRHSILFIVLVVVLIAGAVPGVSRIGINTGFDTFISSRSQAFQDYTKYKQEFGGEPIIILLKGNVEQILTYDNLQVMADLEEEVANDPRFRGIISPVTFLEPVLNELAPGEGFSVLEDPAVLKSVLYSSDGGIRPELSPVIPKPGNVLINLIPSGELTHEQQMEAQQEIAEFLDQHPITGMEYLVSSDAEVLKTLSEEISKSIGLLLGLAVVVMFVILFLLFRVRWRLLSLLMVLIATLWAFGLMGYFGISLSMTTMAVVPILIGLGIDYSLQFHNRYQEEITRQSSVSAAIIHSMASISPAVGIAFGATTIGFLTLLISRVPMVRDFGIVLALGILLSYIVALFLLNAILARRDRKASLEELKTESREASHREERVLGAIARRIIGHPIPLLILAVALFLAGAILDHRLPVVTEWERLMPQDIPALQELREVRSLVGYAGELRFMIEGEDVLRPEVLRWMQDYEEQELDLHPELKAVASPATFITQSTGGAIPEDEGEIDGILASVPAPLRQGVVNDQENTALISFPLAPLPLEEVNRLVEAMEGDIEAPPDTRVAPTGTLVLGTKTMDAMVSTRLPMILAGVAGVLCALLVLYRRLRRVVFAVVPMSLVLGWSSAAMYFFGISLNPLTAIMSAIIIGIGTEFAVLLLERYHEEMNKGYPPREAMLTACSSLGRAIVVSALTTLGGFACLIGSDFVMIRDFGIVTVIDVFLCLVSVMIVLPPLVVWFDEWRLRKLRPAPEAVPQEDVGEQPAEPVPSVDAGVPPTSAQLVGDTGSRYRVGCAHPTVSSRGLSHPARQWPRARALEEAEGEPASPEWPAVDLWHPSPPRVPLSIPPWRLSPTGSKDDHVLRPAPAPDAARGAPEARPPGGSG